MDKSKEEFRMYLNVARLALFDAMKQHEQAEHNGSPCFEERTNAIAWLSHAIGLKPEHLEQVSELLKSYDNSCHHQHKKESEEKFNVNTIIGNTNTRNN